MSCTLVESEKTHEASISGTPRKVNWKLKNYHGASHQTRIMWCCNVSLAFTFSHKYRLLEHSAWSSSMVPNRGHRMTQRKKVEFRAHFELNFQTWQPACIYCHIVMGLVLTLCAPWDHYYGECWSALSVLSELFELWTFFFVLEAFWYTLIAEIIALCRKTFFLPAFPPGAQHPTTFFLFLGPSRQFFSGTWKTRKSSQSAEVLYYIEMVL